MANLYEQVKGYIEDHREEMLAMWKDFVETPSQARNREAAMNMKVKIVGILEGIGMEVTEYDVGPVNSQTISGILGKDRPGKPVMFGGHYDTVNSSPVEGAGPGDPNEFDGTPHFRMDEEGKCYGLGALDMKGGIVIAIWIIKALESVGWKERPLKILLAGDEDKGHFDGTTKEILVEAAKGALCCFNMETGRIGNEICIGRKGGGEGEVFVDGVAAHAGNDYASGKNAVLQMTYIAQELHKLTRVEEGTTVTPTVIKGGTVPNGIPDYCHLDFDFRYTKNSEAERVKAGIMALNGKTFVEGTKTRCMYKEYMPPFDETPEGRRLAQLVDQVSREQGLGEMKAIHLGGSSDACFFTIAGVPTICAVGVRGQFNHSSKEYAIVESLYERAKVLACTVLDIEKFANPQ